MCPKFIAEYCIEIHAACKWFDSKFFSKSYTPWHIVLFQSHGDFGTFGVVLRQNTEKDIRFPLIPFSIIPSCTQR